jgi:hypothetical protein
MRAGAIVALVCGCSYALVERVPEHADSTTPCTESRAAPIADGVLALGGFAAGVVAFMTIPKCQTNCANTAGSDVLNGFAQTLGAASIIVVGGMFAVSGLRGYSWTKECRALHASHTAPPP